MATRKQAEKALERNEKHLLRKPGVIGLAVGRKEAAGALDTRGWCVRVFVERKTRRRTEASVPRYLVLRTGQGQVRVPTDVEEIGTVEPHQVVEPGSPIEMGPRGASKEAGTAGVILDFFGEVFVLTAGHVFGGGLLLDPARCGHVAGVAPIWATVQKRDVGFAWACSTKERLFDLGLILLIQGTAKPHRSITGVRDIHKDRLRPAEIIDVLTPSGALRTSYRETAEYGVRMHFTYRDANGKVRPTLVTNLMPYLRAGLWLGSAKSGRLESGCSGSAVVDEDGRLLGIHIGGSDPSRPEGVGYGFAVCIEDIIDWLGLLEVEEPVLRVPGGTVPL